jgi:hypothetical protein
VVLILALASFRGWDPERRLTFHDLMSVFEDELYAAEVSKGCPATGVNWAAVRQHSQHLGVTVSGADPDDGVAVNVGAADCAEAANGAERRERATAGNRTFLSMVIW